MNTLTGWTTKEVSDSVFLPRSLFYVQVIPVQLQTSVKQLVIVWRHAL